VDRISSLQRMVETWQAPISASIFVDHEGKQLDQIREARQASQEIQDYVDFHVVFKNKGDETYPINVLRNTAIEHSRTKFMIHLDADFVPSPNLYSVLEKKKTNLHRMMQSDPKKVFVVPAFEMDQGVKLPKNKEEIWGLLMENKLLPVHIHIHNIAHRATNYSHWYMANEIYQISKFEREYEPYILSTNTVPAFDPRFKGYGHDKASFFVELDILNYKIFVLPDVWTIHVNHGTPSWKGKASETLLWRNWYSFIASLQSFYDFPYSRYQIISEEKEEKSLEDVFGKAFLALVAFLVGLFLFIMRKTFSNRFRIGYRRRKKDVGHEV